MIFFFSYSPYICRGDSAQRIFVRLVRGYVHSKNSYLPRKVQCMKKSYMKGRKKGVVGSLPKSMRYCELWMGVISYSNRVMRYCILNQPTKKTAAMYSVLCVSGYTLIHISTMSGILKNPFSVVEIGGCR